MDNTPFATPGVATLNRLWPSWGSLALSGTLGVASLVLFVLSVTSGQWLPSIAAIAILLWAVATLGWVDLELGSLRHVTAFRHTEVHARQIAYLDVGSIRSKSTKWWFPVAGLHDQSEVELRALRTVSKKKAQRQAVVIGHVIGHHGAADPDGDFVAPPPGRVVASQETFTPLRGLDHIYKP